MYGIFLSAINTFAGWLVRSVLVKFVVMFALYTATTEIIPVLGSMLPSLGSLQGLLNNVPPSVAYFLNLCRFDIGLSMVISAYATRFLIRRLPMVG